MKQSGHTVRQRTTSCLILLALAVMVLGVFLQTGSHSFINLDDSEYVYENPHVKKGLVAREIAWAFLAAHAGNWHPLTWISHMADVELFGLDAGRHHATSVVLHLANTVLLFILLNGMTGAPWRSGFAAALFGVHPLHVESVAWVAERKDVLCAFFGMLALLSYLRYVRRPEMARFLPVAGFFALGLMSKPMLVTLPMAMLLLDYWPLERIAGITASGGLSRGRFPALPLRRLLLEKVPLFLLSAAVCAVTVVAQRDVKSIYSLAAYTAWPRIATALTAYAGYLWKLVYPRSLAVMYPNPWLMGTGAPIAEIGAAVLTLGAVSWFCLRRPRVRPWMAVGWLWYLGTLVPVIGLVQVGSQAMADRYTYLPLIGPFLMLAWGGTELAERLRMRPVVPAVLGGIAVLCLAGAAHRQTAYWRDSKTLLGRSLEVTSDNWLLHVNLGVALSREGRDAEALAQFFKALRIYSGSASAHNNIGVLLEKKGNYAEAAVEFREALRIEPDVPEAWLNLGSLLEKQGRNGEAASCYREALRIKPGDSQAKARLNALTGVKDGPGPTTNSLDTRPHLR
jgi:tetratricopeptide (TPR) repeat protein